MTSFSETDYIYLDHNATTPIDPVAAQAMMPFLGKEYGNPSSPYDLGLRSKNALEEARRSVALLLGCRHHEVVFTSGGTESNNAVLKGVIDLKRAEGAHLIVSSIEHPAVTNPAIFLMEQGAEVDFLPVDPFGRVDPDDVRRAIRPQTKLISIMLANNETGTLQPIRDIAEIAKAHDVALHTDAAQALGKVPVDVDALGVDFLSVAGHKLYGPKGVGALFIREGRTLTPLIHGAGQESGRRPGTENVMLSVGLGAACRMAAQHIEGHMAHMATMRDRLEALLFEGLDGLSLNGHPQYRLPNTLNVSVPGIDGAKILEGLPDLFASTGAACHDRKVTLSHVLAAMGVPPEVGMGTLRLTTGRSNDISQIETAAEMIITRVREMKNGR